VARLPVISGREAVRAFTQAGWAESSLPPSQFDYTRHREHAQEEGEDPTKVAHFDLLIVQ